ncbi:hypothetical protein J4573_02960 [Actinomadura barringtoniae]|uniref:Uncharacterized protein n=1 Tax=Actinomadura barringtoniae TaxID=1427535 RepID=A0A939T315_9ACTN|nr:hypothetical protein [Actinomadura barringtoniae]MBO2446034.1 hypothetical protein [Actinomadura barringtoniae]
MTSQGRPQSGGGRADRRTDLLYRSEALRAAAEEAKLRSASLRQEYLILIDEIKATLALHCKGPLPLSAEIMPVKRD